MDGKLFKYVELVDSNGLRWHYRFQGNAFSYIGPHQSYKTVLQYLKAVKDIDGCVPVTAPNASPGMADGWMLRLDSVISYRVGEGHS